MPGSAAAHASSACTSTGRDHHSALVRNVAVRSGRVLGFGPVVNVGDAASNTRDVVAIATTPDGLGYHLAVSPPF